MSKRPSGLGRGLEALLPKTPGGVVRLPLAAIRPGSLQPRRRFPQEGLEELAASIREKGLLQPLLVRPRGEGYELVAGERRFRAAQLAGLAEVPVLVRDLTDREALELALVENLQREDLSPVEEARGYQALLGMGLTQEEVAKRVGKARSTVANALRLLQLPEEVLEALEGGWISAGHARALLMLEPEDRVWGLREILAKGLSVRQAEALRERLARGRVGGVRDPSPLSLELSRHLGLPVRVVGGRRGKVVIHFRSLEELEALLRRLGYQA
ncbi:ParB/RepB/Spo0J family partition protein [Thermus thermamylovorans]|uniref:ParB/RepB/Spo0J family partition protein n=1 Tax=Thermus thermamylovorans TaxID=2509362 RepID=A0A4Q9B6E9_9DEIN|nr:ParB/RepB/Spo0J family partition protein [Thermus thermamylovorans]TBH21247.1 ParB/RepB/Spo0J family partition protein [Thermus thermamylovorans]